MPKRWNLRQIPQIALDKPMVIILMLTGAAAIVTSLVAMPPLSFVLAVFALGFATERVLRHIWGETAQFFVFFISMIWVADGIALYIFWERLDYGTFEWWQTKAIVLFAYVLPFHLFAYAHASEFRSQAPERDAERDGWPGV